MVVTHTENFPCLKGDLLSSCGRASGSFSPSSLFLRENESADNKDTVGWTTLPHWLLFSARYLTRTRYTVLCITVVSHSQLSRVSMIVKSPRSGVMLCFQLFPPQRPRPPPSPQRLLEWEGWLTWDERDVSWSFMTMTFGWGGWMYWAVTGVTSDVGVPSI